MVRKINYGFQWNLLFKLMNFILSGYFLMIKKGHVFLERNIDFFNLKEKRGGGV